MTFEEYRQYDALGLAELVKKRSITPSELIEIAIQRAEAVNLLINAISYNPLSPTIRFHLRGCRF